MSEDVKPGRSLLDRRTLLRGGAAAALAAPVGVFGAQAFPFRAATPAIDFSEFPICRTASDAPPLTGAPRKLKLSWNAGAVCLVPLPVAIDHGIFKKHNLDVELVNYSGSTDQLLEAIATGKSDAGLGMALRWLKPLEQGFDVKIAAGTHGGCMRVLSRTNSGIDKLADLKGKIVGVGDLGGPDKNFFSVQLFKQGIDPNKDVDWRVYPGNLLQLAVEKGEVQAFLASDPIAYIWLKDSAYKEVASNLDGEYKRHDLLHRWSARQPRTRGAAGGAGADPGRAGCGDVHLAESGQARRSSFRPMRPRRASPADLQAMVRYHTHHHHPTGDPLKRELKAYADDLKLVSVFKPSTDTAKFAERIYVDVFGRSGRSRCRIGGGRASRGPAAIVAGMRSWATALGVLASVAWVGFGLSCLWWADLADWPRSPSARRSPPSSSPVGILAATLGANWLGRFGPALRQRAPWLLALGGCF